MNHNINNKVTSRLKIFIFILFFSVNFDLSASSEVSKTVSDNAYSFLKSIDNKNYKAAYNYLNNGEIEWRLDGMEKNRTINSEDDFIRMAPVIFNKLTQGQSDLSGAKIKCCLSSYLIFEHPNLSKGVTFYFNRNGTPKLIVNSNQALPSFDCSRAESNTEITICNSHKLSVQDQVISKKYKLAAKLTFNNSIKSEQLSFIYERENCNSSEDCIYNITQKRISELNNEIQIEKSRTRIEGNLHQRFKGTWLPKGVMIHASITAPLLDEQYFFLEKIVIGTDFILIYKKSNPLSMEIESESKILKCKVTKEISTSYSSVYFNTFYNKNYYGRSGQDFSKLPFDVNYSTYEMNAINSDNKSCGIIIRTGRENDILFYSDEYIDGILVDKGFLLKTNN